MNMTPIPQDQLVTHAMRGDTDAFGTLVDRYQGCVCAIALGITGSVAASEDVAQDVFIAAWSRRGTLQHHEAFPSWLRQIARRKSQQHVRTHTRRTARVIPHSEAVDKALDGVVGPVDALIAAEDAVFLEQALQALPEDARAVVTLFYREGQSTKQVADLLDIPESTVRKRLSRARQRLREDVQTRVSGVLRRTRPGAALTLLIMQAIHTDVAHAASSDARPDLTTRRGWLAAVGVMLVAALALWSQREPIPPSAVKSAGPSETIRYARAIPPQAKPVPAPTDEPEEPPAKSETIVIHVAPGRHIRRMAVSQAFFRPSEWFPTPDEAPLPDLPTTPMLQELLDVLADPYVDVHEHRADMRDIVDQAYEDGLLPLDPASELAPWTMLTALETARLERFVTEDGEEAAKPPTILAISRRLQEQQEDEALADYARLYTIGTLLHQEIIQPPDGISELVNDAILDTRDPRVIATTLTAVPIFASMFHLDLSPEIDAHVRDAVANIPRPDERWSAALVMAEQAALAEDAESARWWMSLAKEAANTPMTGPSASYMERMMQDETPRVSAQLSDLLGSPPTSWRESVSRWVWDCYRAAPTKQRHTGTIRETTQWQWQANTPETDFTACMKSTALEVPHPPPETMVTVSVIPVYRPPR